MEKMDPQEKNKKNNTIKRKKKDLVTDEANIVDGVPFDQVKDIAPHLYNEIVSKESTFKVEEVYDNVYGNEELDFDSDDFESHEIIDVNEENLDKLSKIAKERRTELDTKKDLLEGFDPTAIDFIRRANTKNEAIEVINYLEKRKELSADEAKELKEKLATEGLESFGSHKKHGYYFQVAEEQKLKNRLKLTKRKDEK